MKKTLLLLSAIILFFAGCNKDPEVTPMKVTSEVTHLGGGTVMITGSYEYMMNIEGGEFEIRYSLNEDMSSAQSEKVVPVGNDFSVTLTGLDIDKQYYYRFYFSGKYNSFETEVQRFNLGDGDDADYVMHKNVLLENYQGVRCVNCPSANELAIDLQDKYDGRLIVLGVHAGALATAPPNTSFPDFKTEEGEQWLNYFGVVATPSGMVNRKYIDGISVIPATSWEEIVVEVFQDTPIVGMAAQLNYDKESRVLEADIKIKSIEKITEQCQLTICVVEDNIVGSQYTPQGIDSEYVHRNVFRQTINGEWGEELNLGNVNIGDEITRSYTVTLNDKYNANECYMVAYVSNATSKEVLQVIQKKIVDDNSEEETTGTINGREYVDLGLPSGLKWASRNVGAISSTDVGAYYAWGMTTIPEGYDYSIANCDTYNVEMNDIVGNSQYDVARAYWGATWRMPTEAEYEELSRYCTWEWKQNGINGYSGKNGYIVTGPNDNNIFLPAAGYYRQKSLSYDNWYGYYWCSAPSVGNNEKARCMSISSSGDGMFMSDSYRSYGQSVRPVSE